MRIKNWKKVRLSWGSCGLVCRLGMVFLLALGVLITFSSCVMFRTQSNQLRHIAVSKAEHEVELYQAELTRRMEIIEYSTTQLAAFTSAIYGIGGFEEILLDQLRIFTSTHGMSWGISFYSADSGKILTASKVEGKEVGEFSPSFISDISKVSRGILITDVDRDIGTVHIGTPVYSKEGMFVGAIVFTGDLKQAFPEIPGTLIHEDVYRAVVDDEGEYVWKYEAYKRKYPDSTLIWEDVGDFPRSSLVESNTLLASNGSIIVSAPVRTPGEDLQFAIVQIRENVAELDPIDSLRGSLYGVSMGFAGILGLVFVFVARVIGVEIKLKEATYLRRYEEEKNKQMSKEEPDGN